MELHFVLFCLVFWTWWLKTQRAALPKNVQKKFCNPHPLLHLVADIIAFIYLWLINSQSKSTRTNRNYSMELLLVQIRQRIYYVYLGVSLNRRELTIKGGYWGLIPSRIPWLQLAILWNVGGHHYESLVTRDNMEFLSFKNFSSMEPVIIFDCSKLVKLVK